LDFGIFGFSDSSCFQQQGRTFQLSIISIVSPFQPKKPTLKKNKQTTNQPTKKTNKERPQDDNLNDPPPARLATRSGKAKANSGPGRVKVKVRDAEGKSYQTHTIHGTNGISTYMIG